MDAIRSLSGFFYYGGIVNMHFLNRSPLEQDRMDLLTCFLRIFVVISHIRSCNNVEKIAESL